MSFDEHEWEFVGPINDVNPHALRWECRKCGIIRIKKTEPQAKSHFDVAYGCTCDIIIVRKFHQER